MKLKLNFNISEFNISGKDIPQQVCDKLLHKHILPMHPVREELGISITASLKSGYRSPEWELAHKRNGTSQHCFGQKLNGKFDPKEDGAVDWTCFEFPNNKDKLLASMIKHTDYTRMAVYKGFIHGDYKPTPSGRREVYTSDAASNWKFLKYA